MHADAFRQALSVLGRDGDISDQDVNALHRLRHALRRAGWAPGDEAPLGGEEGEQAGGTTRASHSSVISITLGGSLKDRHRERNVKENARAAPGKQPLAGKTVAVTGTLQGFSRKQIEDLIRELGGTPAGSVSRNTDLVVCGSDPGSKLAKARELGINVVDEVGFFALAGRKPG